MYTRNFVGRSGKIYLGSMEAPTQKEAPNEYPGGYVMTYDPKTGIAECLGVPCSKKGVIDVVADEERNIIYIVLVGAEKPWVLYDMEAREYRGLGSILTVCGTTLIDSRGYASAITKDFELAQYNPDTGIITVCVIVVGGKKLMPGHRHRWAPIWQSWWRWQDSLLNTNARSHTLCLQPFQLGNGC